MHWLEDVQAKLNCRVERRGHDQWGVRKIVFLYTDDSLEEGFRLPFWYEWKDTLEPIFQALNIDASRVVRCLLAGLPPGSVIPRHHDRGEWVKYTHRIHLPVITNATKVKFWVGFGKSAKEMFRFKFEAGEALELNNIAEHCVKNFWHHERVHLIFDHVDSDEHMPVMKDLAAGSLLTQDIVRKCGWQPVKIDASEKSSSESTVCSNSGNLTEKAAVVQG